MKKLIVILTLCIFTSLTVATPVAAASVIPCEKNTNGVIISNNMNDALAQLNQYLAGKQSLPNSAVTNGATITSNASTVKASVLKAKATKAAKAKAAKAKAAKASATKANAAKASTTKPVATPTKAPVATPTTAPVATPTKAPVATPTKAPTTSNNTSSYREFQKSVITLVNKERAAVGLSGLTENAELDKVATLKSEDMAKLGYFSHQSPTYGSPFDMLAQFGVKYTAAGENIAYGQSTPQEVMTGWMNSPGHKANILNTNFTQIGVGIAKKANGQYVWTQTFLRP